MSFPGSPCHDFPVDLKSELPRSFGHRPEVLGNLAFFRKCASVVLSEIDRNLLNRCLTRKPRAWEDFVDRFLGLVVHVVRHTAQSRSIRLSEQDKEDLAAEVFLAFVKEDFAILRRFRGDSSLATYLTVVARRVAVRELLRNKQHARLSDAADQPLDETPHDDSPIERVADREEVERLLECLDDETAEVVRLYHLEGKTYEQISAAVGMSANSIGPTLSRARTKMREFSEKSANASG